MLPDLESLRCFEAAATRLNFRLAAAAVALSPPAFSDRIKRLEDQVGEALFVRTTRRVTLTPAGLRLLPRARRVLDEARRCVEEARGAPMPYVLTVGTRFELGLSWLTPALPALSRTRPERTLHLHFGDSPELLEGIRRGSVDCAVSSARLSGGEHDYEVLHEETYAFVASPAVLRRGPLRGPADAAVHSLLDLHPDLPLFRYLVDARPAGEAWRFARVEYLGTIAAVRLRLLQGAGVAVLPRYFIRGELQSKRLREPLPHARLHEDHFRLIWRASDPREPEFRALAAELRALPLQ